MRASLLLIAVFALDGSAAAFGTSVDGGAILLGGWDGGAPLAFAFPGKPNQTFTQVKLSTDGGRLAAVRSDGAMRVWQVPGVDPLLETRCRSPWTFAFAADGTRAACVETVGEGFALDVIDVDTGNVFTPYRGPPGSGTRLLAAEPQGASFIVLEEVRRNISERTPQSVLGPGPTLYVDDVTYSVHRIDTAGHVRSHRLCTFHEVYSVIVPREPAAGRDVFYEKAELLDKGELSPGADRLILRSYSVENIRSSQLIPKVPRVVRTFDAVTGRKLGEEREAAH